MLISRFGALLATGFVLTMGPSAFAASPGQHQAADTALGLDLEALHLSTFTDTLPGTEATAFHALAGDTVRRVYVVRNDGLLPLTRVSVHDPDVSSAAIRCTHDGDDDSDDGDGADLGPLSELTCFATFNAAVGEHDGRVAASALSPLLNRTVSASADAGYTAIAPGLSASLAFANGVPPGGGLPADTTVSATVRIVNSGSAEVTGLRLVPPPSLSGLACSAGPSVGSLAPGASAVCSGSLTTTVGRHDDSLIVAGTWLWDRAITSQGPQSTRSYPIQASAEAAYNGIKAPGPPASPAPPPSPRAAAAPRLPAASPSPSPPASPSPSPPHSPVPTPVQPLVPANVQFVPSRGLSLPLKVLAIVVIPGVAAARRIASRK
ncbi:MAG TPA: hypothetical protein VFA06_23415 [Actinocrinis sp.]|uniref:hypothetical protein n=1 Tax=Actinocrinis sp. TaxID=1920516 RepID=UPI002D2D3CE2|nr:hypothetical protein [Actinocrinis sp.]HZU58849.1 hypothetical protein [Actinocrinis sp.]